MTPLAVVIDADPGTDDAIGILVAVGSPDLQLRAVTTVGGNASVDVTTENALRLLSAVGSTAPVFAGSASPIGSRERFGRGTLARPHRPGRDRSGLGLPATDRRAQETAAVEFLVETFTGAEAHDTVLVTTGPLTNVASALVRAPNMGRSLRRLIIMGGSRDRGNATRWADFNFWADPEAARVVLRAGIPDIVLFPLDVTRRTRLTEDDCAAIAGTGEAGALAAEIIRSRMSEAASRTSEAARRMSEIGEPSSVASPRSASVHDALCTAHLVAPLVSASERGTVDVDTTGGPRRGTTSITPLHTLSSSAAGNPTVEVVRHARADVLAGVIATATRRLSSHDVGIP